MKALVQNGFGTIETMVAQELPIPVIEKDMVLIQVKAISINPVDVRTRAGSAMADHLKNFEPLILGWDISGVITKIGSEVSEFKVGDEVFGLINFLGHGKGYAQYVAARADHIALKPANVTHEQAAAATLAALTAWQLLKHYADVQPGESIIIQAASGGFGHYAVQIAKYLGADVTGISSVKNRNFILGLGADRHIAYDDPNNVTAEPEADIVVDAFSGDSLYNSLEKVKRGGRIISMLPFISDEVKQLALEKNVEIHYSLVHSSGPDMKSIADLLQKGSLKSHVSKVYPFEQMGEAHLAIEQGHTIGKIIVNLIN